MGLLGAGRTEPREAAGAPHCPQGRCRKGLRGNCRSLLKADEQVFGEATP